MIKNFDKVKGQLIELAEALNKFNSENVQLKLIDLLFGDSEKEKQIEKVAVIPVAEPQEKRKRPGRPPKFPKDKEPKQPKTSKEQKPPKAEKAPKQPKEKKVKEPKRRSTERPGPSAILRQLVDTDYFNTKRTIGDIVNHCVEFFKFEYKSTDLSGTLAKLAKDGILSREKNPESNQFEYIKA
ncbi:MAG: hypothetical protein IH598_13110 [Bacteroidales bacterium]|nr:hypothetical protein [Bacteroidales bacterium]